MEYLAGERSDPRSAFARLLIAALKGAGTIVVYNDTFEYSRLDDLARWLPGLRAEIESIKVRMWDLMRAIRRYVYHPEFCGSFSLKAVLPAFLPEMHYDKLSISEGIAAGLAWERYINEATPPKEKAQLRKDLLEYCAQDTLGMARLLAKLNTLCPTAK